MNGYHDKIAWIDLTNKKVEIKPIGDKDAETFVGGGSLGAAYLARMIDSKTDPLGPQNPLIFMTGPLTATRVPASSRHQVISLSPLTGIFGEGNCGGDLGWQLKRSGFDGVVVTGASESPVSIVIDQDDIMFRDSEDLWGIDAFTADRKLKADLDERAVTAIVGPAGEKRVKFASISHNGRQTRAVGRCGLGAVMGSKKLKALVVTSKGNKETVVADPKGLKVSVGRALKVIRERLGEFGQLGNTGGVINYNTLGNLPVNNWRSSQRHHMGQTLRVPVLSNSLRPVSREQERPFCPGRDSGRTRI